MLLGQKCLGEASKRSYSDHLNTYGELSSELLKPAVEPNNSAVRERAKLLDTCATIKSAGSEIDKGEIW